MITLKDHDGSEFKLMASRAQDETHFAKRREIANAITEFKKEGIYSQFRLFLNNGRAVVWFRPRVSLEYGKLTLGCHTFNRKDSKTIIRWANAK